MRVSTDVFPPVAPRIDAVPHRRRPVAGLAALAWAVLIAAQPVAAGGLSFVEHHPPLANQAIGDVTAIALTNLGTHLYTASGSENAVGVYSCDPGTGALTFVESHVDAAAGTDDGLASPTGVATTGDGKCVYVTSSTENKIAVFDRNAATGALTWVEVQEDGVGGVTGLQQPKAIITTTFGQKHVYVAGGAPGAATVAAFGRTPPSCALTHLQTLGNLGVEARALDDTYMSTHLYAGVTHAAEGGGTQGAVTAFARDEDTGLLSVVESESTGDAGPVRSVAWSGLKVYATSGDDTVVTFDRNANTGALTFVEAQRDGGAIDGLRGAQSVAVGGSSQHVYVVGHDEDALAVFRRVELTPAADSIRFLEVHEDPSIDPPNAVLAGAAVVGETPGHVYVGGQGLTVFAEDHCGNGILGVDEQCDDGNFIGGDGCFLNCRLELCDPTPSSGCRAAVPRGASLTIRNSATDGKDQLQFKWAGAATTLAEYGNPTSTASYALCVYDSASNGPPLLTNAAPAGGMCAKGKPCWKATSTSYSYKDAALLPDGLSLVKLREGETDGKARIQIQGQSINLRPPNLPLTLPVTVQVKNTDTGICWEAVYSAAGTNDGTQFKAKSDE